MLKKIIGYIIAFIAGIGAVLFAIGSKRQETDSRIADNERALRESSDRAGESIDRQGTAIDEAITIIGNDKDRKLESENRERADQELVNDSRKLRERTRKYLEGTGD